jgi:hypothetical protein
MQIESDDSWWGPQLSQYANQERGLLEDLDPRSLGYRLSFLPAAFNLMLLVTWLGRMLFGIVWPFHFEQDVVLCGLLVAEPIMFLASLALLFIQTSIRLRFWTIVIWFASVGAMILCSITTIEQK